MRWQGREQSSNIEDRRGRAGAATHGRGPTGTEVLARNATAG